MTLPIDLPETRRLLREVVAERPEFVYQAPDDEEDSGNCLYVHEAPTGKREPGCIAGQVLHRAGVPLTDLQGLEGFTITSHDWGDRPVTVTSGFNEWLTDDAARYLGIAQHAQDRHEPWSEALATAEKAFPE